MKYVNTTLNACCLLQLIFLKGWVLMPAVYLQAFDSAPQSKTVKNPLFRSSTLSKILNSLTSSREEVFLPVVPALLVPDLKTFKCLLLISTNTPDLLYKRYLTSVTHHGHDRGRRYKVTLRIKLSDEIPFKQGI